VLWAFGVAAAVASGAAERRGRVAGLGIQAPQRGLGEGEAVAVEGGATGLVGVLRGVGQAKVGGRQVSSYTSACVGQGKGLSSGHEFTQWAGFSGFFAG
jgi:hypothetical protein